MSFTPAYSAVRDAVKAALLADPAISSEVSAAALALKADAFVVRGASPEEDSHALIMAQIAAAKTAGGGRVILPYIGGSGYQVSDAIVIDGSNISVELHDDLRLTKVTRAAAILFTGAFGTHISNVELVGIGLRRVIDGNGDSMSPMPTYADLADDGLASFTYAAVCFVWCDNWRCENIEATNGLMNSLRFVQCGAGVVRQCVGSYAVYDNGISVDFNPSNKTFSDTDPSTWSNTLVEDCVAHHNESLGMTSYGAVGVVFQRPVSYANGNDDPAQPHNGGGISVENDLRNMTRNLRCSIIEPTIMGNYSYGLFVSAPGASVTGGTIEGTILPSARIAAQSDVTASKGCNITVLGAGSVKTARVSVSGSGSSNVRALAIGGSGVGDISSGSNQLTLASGSGFRLGVILRATGIPAGTTIIAGPTGGGAGVYTMSANATATTSSLAINWELFPSLDIDGRFASSTSHNFDVQGISEVVFSPSTRMTRAGNGTGFTGIHVNATNAGGAYNPGGGSIRISGQMETSQSFAADINFIGQIFIDGLYLRDPRVGQTAGAAIRLQNASRAYVNNVTGRDSNAKTTYAVDLTSTVASAFLGKVAYSATGLTGPALNNAAASIASN